MMDWYTWEPKRAQQKATGGYDYKFVNKPPDSLKCLICLLVARDPQQHGGCGKLFCKSCITTYKAQRNNCPYCRQPLEQFGGNTTIFNDFKSHQEVKSLRIVCNNECGWKGELDALDKHVSTVCENAQVPCPNECKKSSKILRRNLVKHLESECMKRKLPCSKCQQKIEYQNLKHHLIENCPKRQYSCPNCEEAGCYDERTTTHLKVCPKVKLRCAKCSVQIFRCNRLKHSLTCTSEPVPCKYSEIGCKERPLRKNLKEHEEDAQFHLAIATEKVLQLTKTLSLLSKNTITFKVTDFKNKRDSKKNFYSSHFFTSNSGYKLCVCVMANGCGAGKGTHVSVFAHLMKGDNDDSLTWPFTGTVTFELLNQLEDRNHHKATSKFPANSEVSERVVDSEKAWDGWGRPTFISHTELDYAQHKNCQYLKDDTLIFRALAEAPDYKPWLECTS